jgi:hypothetical protein
VIQNGPGTGLKVTVGGDGPARYINASNRRERHVVPQQFEVLIVEQGADVATPAGEEVVDAGHLVPLIERRPHRCEPMKPAPPVTRMRLLKFVPHGFSGYLIRRTIW